MGPSLGRLGDTEVAGKSFREFMPQWGRASEGSETLAGRQKVQLSRFAAMGPSLGRLGDGRCPGVLQCRHVAAMGPSLGRLGDAIPNWALDGSGMAAMGPSLGRLGDSLRRLTTKKSCTFRRNGAEPRKARRHHAF